MIMAKQIPDERRDFSSITREIIAKSAGFKCSIRGCLVNTICKAEESDRPKGVANFGVASHIYAASPTGPRPAPIGMTDEQIMDQSNGIWTCGSCSIKIDKVKLNPSDQTPNPEYSAKNLFEMKMVRESAVQMSASDSYATFLEKFITPYEFDEIFWNRLPELDLDVIRNDIRVCAASKIMNLSESTRSAPEDKFKRKSLPEALQKFILNKEKSSIFFPNKPVPNTRIHSQPDLVDQTEYRQKVAEIVDGWAQSIGLDLPSGNIEHRHDAQVKITARNPQNMEMCETYISAFGEGFGFHHFISDDCDALRLHVKSYSCSVNNLEWKLDVNFDGEVMRIESTLSFVGNILPKSFKEIDWEDRFFSYAQIVQKIADGWRPIGFIDMKKNYPLINHQMYSRPFDIDLKISQSKLEECLYRIEKIKLAIELQRYWFGMTFLFTELYFSRALLPEMIRAGSNDVMIKMQRMRDTYPHAEATRYWRGIDSHPLLGAEEGRPDFKFVLRSNYISIERVAHLYRHQSLNAPTGV